MTKKQISAIFTCYNRPILTELVLDQFVNVGGTEFVDEIIGAYGGNDPEYIQMLEEFEIFDEIVIERKDESVYECWSRAHKIATGPWYFFFQNDDYLIDTDVFVNLADAMAYVDFCRVERRPFTSRVHETFQLDSGELGVYEGPYMFNHNAGLRSTQFPFTGDIDMSDASMIAGERACDKKWQDRGFTSGLLADADYGMNLGIYSCYGTAQYTNNNNNINDRLYLDARKPNPVTISDIRSHFSDVAVKEEHVELFNSFINKHHVEQ